MSLLIRTISIDAKRTVEIRLGDLTQEVVDAIVNAANSHLMHGGGVAGAIVRAGGYSIQKESDQWVKEHGEVSHSKPAYTGAGTLPCRYIIHVVGPVWGEGEEDKKLEAAIFGSLETAQKLGVSSIAFPAISTGIFNFPKDRAAAIFKKTIWNYFIQNTKSIISLIRMVLNDDTSLAIFLSAFTIRTVNP